MTTVASVSPLGRHGEIFACPTCRQSLVLDADSIRCEQCDSSYLSPDGNADFAPVGGPKGGFAPLRLQDPLIASRYEACSRPAFFRIMSGNWQDQMTYEGEREYLRSQLAEVRGPILDLACGAGSWTKAIADVVGVEEVIGLDISKPLLERCRVAVPGILAVRGSALSLPFRDSRLAAVVCWNSLQQIPTPERVIAEIGRCLRDGGLFTLLTYREADDPLSRYFQRRHEAGFGVKAFAVDQIRDWLGEAGCRVRNLTGPGSLLILTAERVCG
jgi:SAM-dependent methyltransferase